MNKSIIYKAKEDKNIQDDLIKLKALQISTSTERSRWMNVKFKDLESGDIFKARELYATHEEYYMKIVCIYEGSNAVRLNDGRTIQFNNLADVTKVEVDGWDLVKYIDEQREQEE